MKQILTLFLSLAFAKASVAQFDKQIVFRATANFNVVLGGLATNDAGAGLGLDASFFSKRKLQLVFEASGDRFIGDKLLVVDSVDGRPTKNAAVYGLKIGPQYFITKHIAMAATYGPAWSVVREFDFRLDHSFKYSFITFWGKRRHFTTKLFLVQVSTRQQGIRYLGIAAGLSF